MRATPLAFIFFAIVVAQLGSASDECQVDKDYKEPESPWTGALYAMLAFSSVVSAIIGAVAGCVGGGEGGKVALRVGLLIVKIVGGIFTGWLLGAALAGLNSPKVKVDGQVDEQHQWHICGQTSPCTLLSEEMGFQVAGYVCWWLATLAKRGVEAYDIQGKLSSEHIVTGINVCLSVASSGMVTPLMMVPVGATDDNKICFNADTSTVALVWRLMAIDTCIIGMVLVACIIMIPLVVAGAIQGESIAGAIAGGLLGLVTLAASIITAWSVAEGGKAPGFGLIFGGTVMLAPIADLCGTGFFELSREWSRRSRN